MEERTLEKLGYFTVIEQLRECCWSPLGAETAQRLLPAGDRLTIAEALAETSEAQQLLRRQPRPPLDGLQDARPGLEKIERGGVLEGSELLVLLSALRVSRRMRQFLAENCRQDRMLKAYGERLGDFSGLEKRIGSCITEEGEVADTASPELHRLVRLTQQIQVRIREKLEQMLKQTEVQRLLQDNLVTLRRNRYVMPVKQECRSQFAGIVHDQSASGATVYMEPLVVVNMNNELKRLEGEIEREIERILRELSQLVQARRFELEETLQALAAIDFALAKGKLSLRMNAGAPEITDRMHLALLGARHPLLGSGAVPISAELGKAFDVLVITGPNTGGKTVALKTIGLLCLMAQAGLHIPAELGTVVPVWADICIDIGDEQSIEQSLSTFSAHMATIVGILRRAGERSLVLLDELGAGTDPTEGAALAMAIVERLQQAGAKLIATTHYSELKVFAYNTPRVENGSVEFDAVSLRPTYRLRIGLPGSSNAFAIATRLGLETGVVERARQFISQEELHVGELLQNLKERALASEQERKTAEQLRRNAQELENELRQKQREWKEKEAKLRQKAHEDAIEVVRQAKREAEGIVRELRQKATSNEGAAAKTALNSLQDDLYRQWGTQPEPESAVRFAVQVGDRVEMPRLSQSGVVLELPPGGEEVQVQVGSIRLKLPLSELRPAAAGREESPRPPAPVRISLEKAGSIKNEVHLRGKTVDEALDDLEKYLDDAVLAGLHTVYVIHGRGTGTLRTEVRRYLTQHPQVAAYRPAYPHEGGIGVTVAELKS